MLQVNSNHTVESQIRDAYAREVARRLGKKAWSFPHRSAAMVPTAANIIISLGAKTEDYVRAQFVSLPREFCLQTFKTAYPPFGCLIGPRSKIRYHNHMLTVNSHVKDTEKVKNEKIIDVVYQQVSTFKNTHGAKNKTNLLMLVMSKSISMHTLAYLKVNNLVKKLTVYEILDFLFEEKSEADAYERFDSAERTIRSFLGLKNEG